MQVRSWFPKWRTRELKVIASLIAVLSVLLIYWAIPTFFTSGNVVNLLRQVAINGIIASGMTIVMIGGGFDLSVGAILALSGVLAIQLAKTNVWFGILCPVALGAGAGVLNGTLVSRFAINPLIVTLGSRYLVYASANLFTAGFIQYNGNPAFLVLGRSSLGAIPAPVIVFLGVALVSHLILNHATIGAALFAVGSNERAAFFSGLPSRNILTLTYVATGACAALAGVVLASGWAWPRPMPVKAMNWMPLLPWSSAAPVFWAERAASNGRWQESCFSAFSATSWCWPVNRMRSSVSLLV